jgi:hypothetical protein
MTLSLSRTSWNARSSHVPAPRFGDNHDSIAPSPNALAELEVLHAMPESRVQSLATTEEHTGPGNGRGLSCLLRAPSGIHPPPGLEVNASTLASIRVKQNRCQQTDFPLPCIQQGLDRSGLQDRIIIDQKNPLGAQLLGTTQPQVYRPRESLFTLASNHLERLRSKRFGQIACQRIVHDQCREVS